MTPAILAVIAFQQCAPIPPDAQPHVVRLPTQKGTKWVYDYCGKHDGQLIRTVSNVADFNRIKTLQLHSKYVWAEGGTERSSASTLEMTLQDGSLFLLAGKLPEFQLLKTTCRVGDRWHREHTDLAIDRTETRVLAFEKTTVPAGVFESVLLETKAYRQGGVQWKEKSWYSTDIGLVKSTGGAAEVELSLRSFNTAESFP